MIYPFDEQDEAEDEIEGVGADTDNWAKAYIEASPKTPRRYPIDPYSTATPIDPYAKAAAVSTASASQCGAVGGDFWGALALFAVVLLVLLIIMFSRERAKG